MIWFKIEGLLISLLPINLVTYLSLLFLLGLKRLRASIISNSRCRLFGAFEETLRLGLLWNRMTDYCRHSRLSIDFLMIAIPLMNGLLRSLLILRAQFMLSGSAFFLF